MGRVSVRVHFNPAAPKAEFQPTTSWKFIPVYIIACVSDGLSV